MSGEEEGFLSRWSRRKRAPEAEAPQPEPEKVESPPPAPRPEGDCPAPAEPELDLTALPRIEDLDLGSDLTAFLRPGIPTALRSAALRRMWSLDPGIRDFIGPSDYAWDYNTAAGMPPGFSFDLGGNLKELLAQAIGEREEAPPEATTAEGAEAEPEAEPAAPQLVAEAAPEAVPASQPRAEPTPEPGAPRRRHGGALPS
ncbi:MULTISPECIES: DUF3306 domain-containing protein [Roseomonadaceae]|uniref:DUF3306 domain-containing protein n=1 Tax=Falsiroseomonas oleicola TaxID=2801474 RepID=A0ABS6H3Y6_9PROT|nr:DUF3306 domain-containing protein [Roseomonas oleicola]MBU8543096.1 DUF3306 domain-containing protein [Roseomonas oleicola]